MKKIIYAVAATCLLGMSAVAQADTVTFSASRALDTTDFVDFLTLGKFDTNLGTLNSIRFDLTGTVVTDGGVESLDAASSLANLSLNASLSLSRPNNANILTGSVGFSQNRTLAEFDGDIDFAGTSGYTLDTRVNQISNSFVSTNVNDFVLFSALNGGNINLGVSATALSEATGPGNVISYFVTQAGAQARVTYDYTPTAVPEPETYAMLLAGLGVVGFIARRRKQVKAA